MKSITIRGIDEKLQEELEKKAAVEQKSINKTILSLLNKALGLDEEKKYLTFNDLDHLAGTWTSEDLKEFEEATKQFNKIDKSIWK
jgi:plasmid stability protein